MPRVLITGASSGIGKEFARVFASNGYDLVLVSRSEDRLTKIKFNLESEYGVCVDVCVNNLLNKDAAREVYSFCKGKQIDVLVNNAGVGDFNDFVNSDYDKLYDIVQLNIVCLMQLTRLFLRDMVDRNSGLVLQVSSLASLCSGPRMAVYYASKSFVTNFSRALQEEIRHTNVSISILCPPTVETNFQQYANVQRKHKTHTITSYDVAKKGYIGLLKKKKVIYCDLYGYCMSIMTHIIPTSICNKIIYYINKG